MSPPQRCTWVWKETLHVGPHEFQTAERYSGCGARKVTCSAHQATVGCLPHPPSSLHLGPPQNSSWDKDLSADCILGKRFHSLAVRECGPWDNGRANVNAVCRIDWLPGSDPGFNCSVGCVQVESSQNCPSKDGGLQHWPINSHGPVVEGSHGSNYLALLGFPACGLRWHLQKPWGRKARGAESPAGGGTWPASY